MGSAGMMNDTCDLLVRNSALESIASNLVETGHWEVHTPGPEELVPTSPLDKTDADLVLRRTEIKHQSEYQYLSLWSETTYRITVDSCPVVEVPNIYPWYKILIEEKWHPAIDRGGWWYGPHLHPNTKVTNLPECATQPTIFSKWLPRRKSASNNYPVYVPSLPAYIDALIYHATHYKRSKSGLASISSWQIDNLTRYLYLELPHQQLPLLIELEEDLFMEDYLRRYRRKPRFVYRVAPGSENELEATRVNDWDPTSFPDWCGTMEWLKSRTQV
jgi:hypothetical protein